MPRKGGRMKRIVFLIIFGFLTHDLAAQESKIHTIDIRFGIRDFSSKDLIISPLVYSDVQTPLNLVYESKDQLHISRAYVSYSAGTATSSTNNFREIQSIDLGYEYQWQLFSFNEKLHFSSGPNLSVNIHKEDPVFEDRDNFGVVHEKTAGYLLTSLGFASRLDYRIAQKHLVSYSQNIPVLSYIRRPGYSLKSSDDGEADTVKELLDDGKITHPGKLTDLQAQLLYRFSFSSRSSITFNALVHYINYPKPFEIKASGTSLLIGYGLKL